MYAGSGKGAGWNFLPFRFKEFPFMENQKDIRANCKNLNKVNDPTVHLE